MDTVSSIRERIKNGTSSARAEVEAALSRAEEARDKNVFISLTTERALARADEIDQNYSDLKQFNTQNMLLSLNRAKDANEIDVVKKLYGLTDE